MKRFLFNILLIFSLLSNAGCSEQTLTHNENEFQDRTKQQTEGYYDSILDYNTDITGEHFKTGILEISKDDDYIHFKIKAFISSTLQEKMLNTKEAFYFNITDFEGRDNLSSITAEIPVFTLGDLDAMRDGDYYLITQSIKIKKNVSSEELEELLVPDNYELQFVTANKQIVAVVMGLGLNMIY